MMKNTEWGAVAYLSHSKYGINYEIRINNNNSFKTGYAATTGSGSSSATNVAMWNTPTGYLASTTGNITGVYDMSGGAVELVMGVQADESGQPLSGRHNIYNSGFNGKLGCPTCDPSVSGVDSSITKIIDGMNFPDSKYYDIYKYDEVNTSRKRRILGDAAGELGPFKISSINNSPISSWYSDNAYFVYNINPWISRGGYINNQNNAGVFYYGAHVGHASNTSSFRIIFAI